MPDSKGFFGFLLVLAWLLQSRHYQVDLGFGFFKNLKYPIRTHGYWVFFSPWVFFFVTIRLAQHHCPLPFPPLGSLVFPCPTAHPSLPAECFSHPVTKHKALC